MLLTRLRHYIVFFVLQLRVTTSLLRGVWRLSALPQPIVTIFGGAKIDLASPEAAIARAIAKELVNKGFSIITGGGPGIMEAANEGALLAQKECIITKKSYCPSLVSGGIGLINLNQERLNPFVQTKIIMQHFFERKLLLVRYSCGYVVCPGGFGTLDELFEIVTLIRCKKMPKYPVILLGTSYWQPMITWLQEHAIKGNLLDKEDLNILTVTDDIEFAVATIIASNKNSKH